MHSLSSVIDAIANTTRTARCSSTARTSKLAQSCTNLAEEAESEFDIGCPEESITMASTFPDVDPAISLFPSSCTDLTAGSLPSADFMATSVSPDDATLREHGYKIVAKITDTLQGELFEGVIVDSAKRERTGNSRVAIKKVSKMLCRCGLAKEGNDVILVEEDVIKEAVILKHLTKDNLPNGGYIAKYIDFCENEQHFFLVMEYAGDITLAQWVQQAFQLMDTGKLKLPEYKKTVKFMFWQLCVAVYWLHHDMDVCHLGLSLDNIVVNEGDFVLDEVDGFYRINPNMTAKIIDFGLAEKFHPMCTSHKMCKWGLRDSYRCTDPKIYTELEFNGPKADMWSLGMILFQLSCGQPLCMLPDEDEDFGFRLLCKDELQHFLEIRHLKKYVSNKMLRVVRRLLEVDEKQRFSAADLLKCDWFTCYYQRYGARLEKKSRLQNVRNLKHQSKMKEFPYYVFSY